jgi:DNA-binding transcriptional LysR family regulator
VSGNPGVAYLLCQNCRPERCGVVVDLSFEDRFVDLIEEGYDLAIRATADPPPAGLVARPLRPMPFVIAASKEYLQRCGVPKSPEDLAQHDCVMIGNRQSWHLTGPNGKIDVPARVVLRFAGMTIAVAHAVSTGIGLAGRYTSKTVLAKGHPWSCIGHLLQMAIAT